MTHIRTLPGDAEEARRLFFDHGHDPAGRIPDVIARSWRRCCARLDVDERFRANRADNTRLQERRQVRDHLRRIVRPELDALAAMVADTGSVVLLADSDGLILDAVGCAAFLRQAQQVALQPGVSWSEAQRGTNAIGTAMVERQPVQVNGGEHYLNCNGIISCAAAPIISPRGELFGVLDVSGDSRQMHLHALGMVRMAIQIIEHRLVLDVPAGREVLRFHSDADLLGSHREGVLILDDGRIVGANSAALQLLGGRWETLLDTSVQGWLDLARVARRGDNGFVVDGAGRPLHGRLSGKPRVRVPVGATVTEPVYRRCPVSEPLLVQATRVLDAGIAVLVTGETGVGKEVFARQLHGASNRRSGPFVPVNCAALPESLIESELFGYVDGAFTGARRKGMPGRVREADGGVLFLDEIGDMPLPLQARLLRMLQERAVTPLGGGRPVAVDFVLICATNCDLATMVQAGTFRQDLYYRIREFGVRLPPLRERAQRRETIEWMLVAQGGRERGLSFSTDALDLLADYPWPGNLRQLSSLIRTLVALGDQDEVIDIAQLPAEIRERRDAASEVGMLDQVTRLTVDDALAACGGNVSEAARRLGIHRSTIYRMRSRAVDGER